MTYVSRRKSGVVPYRGADDEVINDALLMTGDAQKKMLAARKVYMGHRVCKVREEANSHGCFGCFAHGHRKEACKEVRLIYRKCCEAGHMAADCKSPGPVCRNCKQVGKAHNHRVLSNECPLQAGIVQREQARTQNV